MEGERCNVFFPSQSSGEGYLRQKRFPEITVFPALTTHVTETLSVICTALFQRGVQYCEPTEPKATKTEVQYRALRARVGLYSQYRSRKLCSSTQSDKGVSLGSMRVPYSFVVVNGVKPSVPGL